MENERKLRKGVVVIWVRVEGEKVREDVDSLLESILGRGGRTGAVFAVLRAEIDVVVRLTSLLESVLLSSSQPTPVQPRIHRNSARLCYSENFPQSVANSFTTYRHVYRWGIPVKEPPSDFIKCTDKPLARMVWTSAYDSAEEVTFANPFQILPSPVTLFRLPIHFVFVWASW